MKDNLKFILLIIGIAAVFFIMAREIVETKSSLRKTQSQMAQEKRDKVWLQEELKSTKGSIRK